jgi:PAS domain S-box-containing protein
MPPNATYEELEQQVQCLKRQLASLKQNEVSLKESAKRYRILLDFAPYPVATFTLKGSISYLNPPFTEVFGWTLDDMRDGKARFVPPELGPEISGRLKVPFENKIVTRYVTKRLTKDGRLLDVIARGAVFSEAEMGVPGELVIFRDITREKRIAQSNDAMLRISMALPEYPDLEALLDYIAGEIKRLMDTQGALVILLDEEKKEFFFPGAADNDKATQKRVKEIRLPIDSLASAKVVKTGKPLIVNDGYKDSVRYSKRNHEFGYSFDNYVLVPIKSYDRIIGVLAAFNKSEGLFENPDIKLLEMIAGTVGLSIENARFSDELKQSHRELQSLDRAKSKAINHLSHELKTPISIFSGTLQILEKKLETLPDYSWKRSMDRAQRNLERIKHLQDEVRDIILENESEPQLLSFFIDQCTDLLENTIETQTGDTKILDRVRTRINDIFKIKNTGPEEIWLDEFVRCSLEKMRLKFAHRGLKIEQALESTPSVFIPTEPLQKVINGLIKNAVENTPDQGKIKVIVSNHESGPCLAIQDYGVGILDDHQTRIFKGFFTTQGTAVYSSKKPFEFNAGGRGADLLRMKIFSEQYNFSIHVSSKRCKFIPGKNDICPGNIRECSFCKRKSDCYQSGGSIFTVDFKI